MVWTTLALVAVIPLAGYVSTGLGIGSLSVDGFGHYSWNLATLVTPHRKLWPWRTDLLVRDATGGQYEGESYLGVGVLALLGVCLVLGPGATWRAVKRHRVLACVVVACAFFAASDKVFLGPRLIAQFYPPFRIQQIAGLLRTNGRFVWPLVYVLTLVPALLLMRWRPGRAWVGLVLAAAVVQSAEAWPMHQFKRAYTASAQPDLIDQVLVSSWLRQHDRVWQFPSFFCGRAGCEAGSGRVRETQLQLLAARLGLPNNSIYMARPLKDCGREAADASRLRLEPGTLYVLSIEAPMKVRHLAILAASPACRRTAWSIVCSASWGDDLRADGAARER